MRRYLFLLILVASTPDLARSQPNDVELSEFKTTKTCKTAKLGKVVAHEPPQPAYLGIHPGAETVDGKYLMVIREVDADSPAARAGLKAGQHFLVRGKDGWLESPGLVRDFLKERVPGDSITLRLNSIGSDAKEIRVTLGAVSHPMSLPTEKAILGVRVKDLASGDGAKIAEVAKGGAAEKCGLQVNDILHKFDGVDIDSARRFMDTLSEKKPGETVELVFEREGKRFKAQAKLATDAKPVAPGSFSWDTRSRPLWKKDTYRLAVLPIDFPDKAHNEKITIDDWDESLFSKGAYHDKKSATGQPVFGSVNDYYHEISYGKLHIEGKVFDHLLMGRKRQDYSQDANKNAFFTEALDKFLAREGEDALKGYNGVYFLYAGPRFSQVRNNLFWPHCTTIQYHGKPLTLFINPEGGERMDSISVVSHEFGHMLGLPDLYALPEVPGMEGAGMWCNMANRVRGIGRPLHFSAWCKEQLGWLEPTLIDPAVKQKLILSPTMASPRECYKILVRPDGSEYFLLENRVARGFDRDVPGQGLLIWRVIGVNRPLLQTSHGIGGPSGPNLFLGMVPYPSKANNAFTPTTTPSSRSPMGGGEPLYITNIRRLPDGRITFYIGYEFL